MDVNSFLLPEQNTDDLLDPDNIASIFAQPLYSIPHEPTYMPEDMGGVLYMPEYQQIHLNGQSHVADHRSIQIPYRNQTEAGMDHRPIQIPLNSHVTNFVKVVEQLDVTSGDVLRTYRNQTEAGITMQVSQAGISRCCETQREAFGFKWRKVFFSPFQNESLKLFPSTSNIFHD